MIRPQVRDQLRLTGPAQVVLRLGIGGAVPPTPHREPGEVTSLAP